MRREERIEALRKSAQSERRLGNIGAADAFEAKAASMEQGLVPVQKVDTRAAVEAAWSMMDQSALVDVLCCVPGLQRKVRKTMTMRSAMIELTQNGAWLVGRTADCVHVQATCENTPPLSTDRKGTGIWYL